jgi:hypothetical protein
MNISIVLLHHPVINKTGEIIGSAVTNLDLHDIARAARTYDVDHYYVVTPYRDQHDLIDDIVNHWQNGFGARYNPARKEALSIIRPVYHLDDVIADIRSQTDIVPLLVTTSARKQEREISYRELRDHLEQNVSPVLLLFGTAHGLAEEVMKKADAALPAIKGKTDYNHLSVRSAVSIILDRLFGNLRD